MAEVNGFQVRPIVVEQGLDKLLGEEAYRHAVATLHEAKTVRKEG